MQGARASWTGLAAAWGAGLPGLLAGPGRGQDAPAPPAAGGPPLVVTRLAMGTRFQVALETPAIFTATYRGRSGEVLRVGWTDRD